MQLGWHQTQKMAENSPLNADLTSFTSLITSSKQNASNRMIAEPGYFQIKLKLWEVVSELCIAD